MSLDPWCLTAHFNYKYCLKIKFIVMPVNFMDSLLEPAP